MSLAHDLGLYDPRWFGDAPIDPKDIPPDVEPYSDEPEMDSDVNAEQMNVLLDSLKWSWRERNDFYASGNVTIFYKQDQIEGEVGKAAFRGPDFFVVLGADKRKRRSWVVWREGGRYPDIIVEILSRSTESLDRGLKKQIYQSIFRTPEYFLFHPEKLTLEGFRLQDTTYVPMSAGLDDRFKSDKLGLSLGVHQGKLRFFTPDGAVVPTEAEAERARADKAEQGRAKLAAKLRELGIDPDSLR